MPDIVIIFFQDSGNDHLMRFLIIDTYFAFCLFCLSVENIKFNI